MNGIIIGVYVSIFGFIFYMMFRNRMVFKLRQRTNHDIHDADVPFKKTMKMYDLYETISYQVMMWRIFTSPKKIEKEFRERVGLDKLTKG
ncbi:hypothetical protein LCGC14_0844020 [marine sediment metagenome]|uniref:Uncharacterized protein n=1 Tax=marine sediment metagenome TaxID=412755 RepID=A0A0F9PXF2_9ZZZZ